MQQSKGFAAALLDRDGTLVEDVPYNGDPAAVRPVPGAREALDRLREAGVRLGVVTNQSGLSRGLLTEPEVAAVNRRVSELLGPFDTWQVCPHAERDGCTCRKPLPGLVLAAARDLGVPPDQCVVVGDIGSDVAAALAAGAGAVLVPTPATRTAEVAAAPVVAPDLAAAVDWILGPGWAPAAGLDPTSGIARSGRAAPDGEAAPASRTGVRPRVLVARCDSAGDVLLTGPAIRAVAAGASHVTLLCGPRGRVAADLLPGVDDVIEWCVPWIDPQPPTIDAAEVDALVKQIEAAQFDEALLFTSYHQSALPLALLLRLASVPWIAATSEDYPGSLLDLRHRPATEDGAGGTEDGAGGPGGRSEVESALSLAQAAGYRLPAGDDGRVRLHGPLPDVTRLVPQAGYVVLHPGASVPARACPPQRCRDFVAALAAHGWTVVVTGEPNERELTRYVAGAAGLDLGGRTSFAELAAVLARASCVVVGNTGPAHLAAAVATPVVSLFAPTVPYEWWRPYGVPAVRLGDADAPCRGTRAAVCPVPGHPCLSTVEPHEVVRAVSALTTGTGGAR